MFQAQRKVKPFFDVSSKQATERPSTSNPEKDADFSYRDVALLKFNDEKWSVMSDPTFMSTFLKR